MPVLILYIHNIVMQFFFIIINCGYCYLLFHTRALCVYCSIKGHDDELVGEDYLGKHETRFIVCFFSNFFI